MQTGKPDVTFTFQDWLRTPEDGLHHEVLDGEHVVTPSPNLRHQRVSRRIQFQLYEQNELTGRGEVFNAPAGVRLSELDLVEPDLFVVLAERAGILADTHVAGAPDLVVEILSKRTASRDLGIKKARYEACGVREYWIVDPGERVVHQHLLTGRGYRLLESCCDDVSPRILEGVTVDLGRVWQRTYRIHASTALLSEIPNVAPGSSSPAWALFRPLVTGNLWTR